MRLAALAAAATLVLGAAGCGGSDSGTVSTKQGSSSSSGPVRSVAPTSKPKVTVPTGPAPRTLVVKDLRKGTGVAAAGGDTITVHYVGVLFKNGKQFDASWDRGQPFSFVLGANQVIPGWDRGLVGMKVGGRRELIVPPKLGYGAQPQGGIPANSTLVFVVDLLKVR